MRFDMAFSCSQEAALRLRVAPHGRDEQKTVDNNRLFHTAEFFFDPKPGSLQ
jgi:hypothetical protein